MARLERFNFNTPVGRFVSGSMTEKRTTDNDGRPVPPDKQSYQFGIAFAKTDPQIGALIGQIAQNAMMQYQAINPHVVPMIQNWFNTLDGFSMKISDGDKPNQRGQINENTRGHWVFWFSTALDVQACGPDNSQIPLSAIKRGYYVDVYGSSVINELAPPQSGIYMNPAIVRLVAEGDEIVGSVDPRQAFANNPLPATLPPGARPLGSTPAAPALSGPPSAAAPVMGLPGMPAPAAAPVTGLPGVPPQGMQPQLPGVGQQVAPAPGAMGFAPQPGFPTASPSNPPAQPYPGILQPPR
jgi:hypothetical protein